MFNESINGKKMKLFVSKRIFFADLSLIPLFEIIFCKTYLVISLESAEMRYINLNKIEFNSKTN